jgi:hypothetical protein
VNPGFETPHAHRRHSHGIPGANASSDTNKARNARARRSTTGCDRTPRHTTRTRDSTDGAGQIDRDALLAAIFPLERPTE